MRVQFKTAELKAEAKKKGIAISLGLTSSISTKNMYAFDTDGRLKLYADTTELLQEWCSWRLRKYERRREHMLSDLGRSIERLSNTYRFITAVVKRDIDIAAFDSGALVARLKADGYAEIDSSYEYLLRIRVDTLTRDRAAKAMADLEKERTAQAKLRGKTAKDLWVEDLETIAPLIV